MPQERLTGHQKLGFSVFVVIGLATLVLASMQIRNLVAKPFVFSTDISFRSATEIEQENERTLRAQDTDLDGLNDYDELNVFRTSPFLEDSDSDGVNDGTEVATNNDPNCPKGKECRAAKISGGNATPNGTASASATTNTGAGQDPSGAYEAIVETFGNSATLTKEQITAKLDVMTSTELRTFLVKMGIPPAALQKADDATLKQLLRETLGELSGTN